MMGLGQPVPSVLPDPDGTIGKPDRSMFLFLYHGIELAQPNNVLKFGVLSFLDGRGQGVNAEIFEDGKGVLGVISQGSGILAIISGDGKGLKSIISQSGQGVKDKL
jgi:hypothetical protein